MASFSIDIGLNASFAYYGQNASTEILFGELDSAHNSTLSGYWINYPTPWPYLLISVAISIGLGWLGYRSSANSWRPVHKSGQRGQSLPGNGIEMSTSRDEKTTAEIESQPRFYTDRKYHGFFRGVIARGERMKNMSREERRAFLRDKNNSLATDAERAATAEYTAEGQTFDPADDIKPDGGVGKFNMYKTILGIAWTTIRAFSIFILAIITAHDSKTPSNNSSYPGPLSVMILFASAQTYLAGRGMPRLFNVILAYDLVLIWVALVISSFGPGSTTRYYGKIGVQGGNCPFFDRAKYNSHQECAYGRWNTVGCATNSTWDTSEHHYPRAAWWFTGNPDPNTYGNSLLTLELDFKLIGIIYGLMALFLALPMYFLPLAPRELYKPLPAIKFAFLRRTSRTTSLIAFVLVLILSVIAIPLHISMEVSPPKFPYVDSSGPLVPTALFDSDTAQTAIHHTWPSLAWNQSHTDGGVGQNSDFLGGNTSTWSDCFWVQAPGSKTGHLNAWWDRGEGKVLRVLAGL